MYVSMLLDVIHWKVHWSITSAFLYLHAYAFLLAPVWQFPLLFLLGVFSVGVLAARTRSYDDVKLFKEVDVDDGTGGAVGVTTEKETADDHKSMADR